MKKLLTAAFAFGALTASALTAHATDIRFTLGWKTQGSDTAFFVAQQKGYFEEEGLNVTIDQGEGSAATVTRIMSGVYDAGFGDINAIVQNASARPGEAPVMVYNMWSNAPFTVVTKKDSGIENVKDFEGRILGGSQGTPTTRLMPIFARTNDIDLEKISFETMAPNLQEPMLIKGDVDGVMVFSITSYFNLLLNRQDPENDFTWFNFGDYGIDLYSNGVMVSRKLLEENPEAVAGLVRAINKAAIEIALDQEAAIEATVAYDNLVDRDIEKQRLQYAYEKLIMSDEVEEIGMGDLVDDRLARAIDVVVEAYELDRTPEVSEIFTREFLPALDERKLTYTAN